MTSREPDKRYTIGKEQLMHGTSNMLGNVYLHLNFDLIQKQRSLTVTKYFNSKIWIKLHNSIPHPLHLAISLLNRAIKSPGISSLYESFFPFQFT